MRQVSKVVGMSDWYLGLLGLVFESDTLQKKMDHTVWDFDLYKTKDWHTYYHASKKHNIEFLKHVLWSSSDTHKEVSYLMPIYWKVWLEFFAVLHVKHEMRISIFWNFTT